MKILIILLLTVSCATNSATKMQDIKECVEETIYQHEGDDANTINELAAECFSEQY